MNINPITNIVYSHLNPNISLLRQKNNKSLFDYFIVDNESDIQCFYTEDIVQNYYYDLFVTDDILLQDRIHQSINDSQIKTLITVHHEPPGLFKKEDLLIHHKSTKNIPKIFFGQNLIEKWQCDKDDNSYNIEYGIPAFYSATISEDRKHSIVIMNLEDNPYIDNLYNSIQSQVPGCLMIKNLKSQTKISEIIDILRKSKIVIDINNKINALCALSCGCQTVTSVKNLSSPLVVNMNNYSEIIKVLKDLLDIDLQEKYRETGAKQIINKYSYKSFIENINSIFNIYKQQPYIL